MVIYVLNTLHFLTKCKCIKCKCTYIQSDRKQVTSWIADYEMNRGYEGFLITLALIIIYIYITVVYFFSGLGDELRIEKYVFPRYSRNSRPVINSLEKVDVKIQFILCKIEKLVSNTCSLPWCHMSVMASQITNHCSVCLIFSSSYHEKGIECRHYWSFVQWIHRWPLDSPSEGSVMQKALGPCIFVMANDDLCLSRIAQCNFIPCLAASYMHKTHKNDFV